MANKPTPKYILVVEDETYLRDLYVQILEKEGYIVDKAADGEEAYLKLEKKQYDLILLDIILPKMDGLQVLEKLKNESKAVTGSIVLLTNLSQELVISKAVGLGVRGYIVKSDMTPEQIVQEVKEYLENKQGKNPLS